MALEWVKSLLTCPDGAPEDVERRFASTFTPKERLYIKASMKGMFCINLLMNTLSRWRRDARSVPGAERSSPGIPRAGKSSPEGREDAGAPLGGEVSGEDTRFPEDLRYHREHMWAREDGTVGLTYYAQEQLGEIVFLEVREAGTEVKAGEAMGTVESLKAVSDLPAPAGGTITDINIVVLEAPELINRDPYGEGWIARLELRDANELEGLLSAREYRELVCGRKEKGRGKRGSGEP